MRDRDIAEYLDDLEDKGGVRFRPSRVFAATSVLAMLHEDSCSATREACERHLAEDTERRLMILLDRAERRIKKTKFDREWFKEELKRVLAEEEIPF